MKSIKLKLQILIMLLLLIAVNLHAQTQIISDLPRSLAQGSETLLIDNWTTNSAQFSKTLSSWMQLQDEPQGSGVGFMVPITNVMIISRVEILVRLTNSVNRSAVANLNYLTNTSLEVEWYYGTNTFRHDLFYAAQYFDILNGATVEAINTATHLYKLSFNAPTNIASTNRIFAVVSYQQSDAPFLELSVVTKTGANLPRTYQATLDATIINSEAAICRIWGRTVNSFTVGIKHSLETYTYYDFDLEQEVERTDHVITATHYPGTKLLQRSILGPDQELIEYNSFGSGAYISWGLNELAPNPSYFNAVVDQSLDQIEPEE